MGFLEKLNSFLTIEDNSKVRESELIKRIHRDFDTEVDNILREARVARPTVDIKNDIEDKAKRLKRLGFSNSLSVTELQKLEEERSKRYQEQKKKDELVEAVNYFSFKYPNYKFITEERIQKICKKYGLVYSDVSNYIGDVPEKNIRHIEKFSIDDKDKIYEIQLYPRYSTKSHLVGIEKINEIRSILNSSCNFYDHHVMKIEGLEYRIFNRPSYRPRISSSSPLVIAANIKDFKKGTVSVNYQLQDVPDPVVFHKVCYKDTQYYLIVTVWGDEASDELVVNHKMN